MSAPILRQSKETNVTAAASPLTVVMGSNLLAGNLVVVRIAQSGAANRVVSTPTDTPLNTYIKASSSGTYGTDRVSEIWYAKNINGGASTVSVPWATGTDSKDVLVEEYSGCDPTAPLEINDNILEASATSHNSTTSTQTTNANGAAIVTCSSLNGSAATIGPGSGYTSVAALLTSAVWLEQLASAAVVNTRATFTTTNARTNSAAFASFKSSSKTNTKVSILTSSKLGVLTATKLTVVSF